MKLTGRQAQVLAALADGMTTQEVADFLHLSYHTVVSHKLAILNANPDCNNILQATVKAARNNLI